MARLTPIIALVLAIAACGAPPDFGQDLLRRPSTAAPAEDAQFLVITAIDVGQGDATLIAAPNGQALLVDAGPPGAGSEAVLPALDAAGIEELAAIVVTHDHEDHFGGVPELIERLAPKGVVYERTEPERDPESPRFPLYAAATAGRRVALHPGDHLRLGDLDLEVVAAGGRLPDGAEVALGSPPDENAASIALLIEFAGFRMLIAGDITGGGGEAPHQAPDVETPLAPFVGDLDILRVAHHGSATSTNAAFLAATKPEAAIISAGDGNDHGHPHRSVVQRLLDAGAAVFQTERGWLSLPGTVVADGNITIAVAPDGAYSVK